MCCVRRTLALREFSLLSTEEPPSIPGSLLLLRVFGGMISPSSTFFPFLFFFCRLGSKCKTERRRKRGKGGSGRKLSLWGILGRCPLSSSHQVSKASSRVQGHLLLLIRTCVNPSNQESRGVGYRKPVQISVRVRELYRPLRHSFFFSKVKLVNLNLKGEARRGSLLLWSGYFSGRMWGR